MSTRFTVSVVNKRAYATPLVDIISIQAIEQRFGMKLVDLDVGQNQKNDWKNPVFAVVLF